MERWPASPKNSQDIPNGCTGQRCNDTHHPRKCRDRLLSVLIEQSLRRQSFFQLFKCQLQRADSLRLHRVEHDLIFSARFVDREPPPHNNL